MLQIDHVYEFLYQNLFKDFALAHLFNGVVKTGQNINIDTDISIFTSSSNADKKIFFYDQEPLIPQLAQPYVEIFNSIPGRKILVPARILLYLIKLHKIIIIVNYTISFTALRP